MTPAAAPAPFAILLYRQRTHARETYNDREKFAVPCMCVVLLYCGERLRGS